MNIPTEYSGVRYLTAKRTVDDRALYRPAISCIRERLATRTHNARIAELGGGPGTMVDRMLEEHWVESADYTLIDLDQDCLQQARSHVESWAAGRSRLGATHRGRIRVQTEHAALETWLERDQEPFDLIVANAVLDLVDVPAVLPALFRRLAPEGVFWFSINFDGESIFVPEHPHDSPILDAYHRSMGKHRTVGRPLGDAQTGRQMFRHLGNAGATILSAGSSDWVVFPQRDGYVADEAYFLHHIVETIHLELAQNDDLKSMLPAWIETRHQQIEDHTLVYIAHQLDFLGSAPA